MVSVLIADGHPMCRDGIAGWVAARPDLALEGQVGSGGDALAQIARLDPDVVVLDWNLPGLVGSRVLHAMARDGARTRALVIGARIEPGDIHAALEAGAAGVVTKDAGAAELCDAIRAIGAGRTVLDRTAQTALGGELCRRRETEQPTLTERETEILGRIATGSSIPDISAELGITCATVKTHLKRLMDKLVVHNRASAVAEAMRRGLLA